MSYEIVEAANNDVMALRLSGKLDAQAYEAFVPEIERRIATQGSLRMLVELVDFHGWDAGALWADTKFAARHFNDISRLALVGDKAWEKGMAYFCKPFTRAKVRYFDRAEREAAMAWVASND
jgi:SpoIIAA-like